MESCGRAIELERKRQGFSTAFNEIARINWSLAEALMG